MNVEFLEWLGNLVNFLIFVFIVISIVGTNCFSITQMSLTAFGLFASIFIHIISMSFRRTF